MRRFIFIILVIIIAACLAACGSGGESVVVDPNATAAKANSTSVVAPAPASTTEQAQDEGLYFESGGVKLHVYDIAQNVISALGTPKGTFEAPSCAYQGTDKFYYYNGFQLTVNNVDNADHVTVIMVVDDTVSIPQGVKIGSTKDQMLALMGSNYAESVGIYQYVSGATTLQIQVKDNKVAGIQYTYTPNQ